MNYKLTLEETERRFPRLFGRQKRRITIRSEIVGVYLVQEARWKGMPDARTWSVYTISRQVLDHVHHADSWKGALKWAAREMEINAADGRRREFRDEVAA